LSYVAITADDAAISVIVPK